MARERIKQSSLSERFTDVLGDFSDLFRKEIRLARAELSSKISAKVRGGVWLALAGLFGALALALGSGALVVRITTFDVRLHLAFLIVAAGVAGIAVLAYFVGRQDAKSELTPSRTIHQ